MKEWRKYGDKEKDIKDIKEKDDDVEMNKNGKYTHKLAVSGVICGDKARKLTSTLPYYTGKEGCVNRKKGESEI